VTVAELRARLPKVILPERATAEQVCHVAVQYIDLLERNDAMSRAKNRELTRQLDAL